MTFWLVIQLLIVGFFFVMFVRGSKIIWGVGLLTVATAVLFNTILMVFGRERTAEDLGFWFWAINGLLFGGAAFWLWGLLRPVFPADDRPPPAWAVETRPKTNGEQFPSERAASMANDPSGIDLKLLHDQILHNLGPEDIYDLIFDLEMVENDVVSPTRNMRQTIVNIIDLALERGQMSDLALGVERILTPVPPHHFPRLENLRADTPPTILRRYLLAFYPLEDVEKLAEELSVPWELLGLTSKQGKVRNLLLYLRRRQRMEELIEILHREGRTRHVHGKPVES